MFVSVLLVVRWRLLGSDQRFVTASTRGGGAYRPLNLRRFRWPLSVAVGTFITVTSVLPLLGLAVLSSVKALTRLEPPWNLFTTDNWHQVSTDATLRRAITNSLFIAIVGGPLTVLLVTTATLIAHRSGFFLRGSLASVLVYPRAVPGIILGIGFFWSYLLVNPPGGSVRNNL